MNHLSPDLPTDLHEAFKANFKMLSDQQGEQRELVQKIKWSGLLRFDLLGYMLLPVITLLALILVQTYNIFFSNQVFDVLLTLTSLVLLFGVGFAGVFSLSKIERHQDRLKTYKKPIVKRKALTTEQVGLSIEIQTDEQQTTLLLKNHENKVRQACFSNQKEMDAHTTILEWKQDIDDFKEDLQHQLDDWVANFDAAMDKKLAKALEETKVEPKKFDEWSFDNDNKTQLLERTVKQHGAKDLVTIKNLSKTKAEIPVYCLVVPMYATAFIGAAIWFFPGLFGLAEQSIVSNNHKASNTITQQIYNFKQQKGVYPTVEQLESKLKQSHLKGVNTRQTSEKHRPFVSLKGSSGNYRIELQQLEGEASKSVLRIKNNQVKEYYKGIIKTTTFPTRELSQK